MMTKQLNWFRWLGFKGASARENRSELLDFGKIFSPESTYVIQFGFPRRKKKRSINNWLSLGK